MYVDGLAPLKHIASRMVETQRKQIELRLGLNVPVA